LIQHKHNTLYGKTKNKFELELHDFLFISLIRKFAKLADLSLPTLEHDNHASTPPELTTTSEDQNELTFHPIPDTSSDPEDHDEDAQYIDTQYFDVPTPTANFSSTNMHTTMSGPEPFDTSYFIFDPLHYLHYSS
jgi:hypothetical protein